MAAVDARHTERLKAVLTERGWPGRDLVGSDGAHAAWLLAQHSPDLAFQERCLGLLEQDVAAGQASSRDLASLVDRVRVRRGRPQIYGTQFCMAAQTMEPDPIEDPERLDERRSAVGLGPYEEYRRALAKRSRGDIRSGPEDLPTFGRPR